MKLNQMHKINTNITFKYFHKIPYVKKHKIIHPKKIQQYHFRKRYGCQFKLKSKTTDNNIAQSKNMNSNLLY